MFVDTPGIFEPKRRLEAAIVRAALTGVADADVVAVVVDARKGLGREHPPRPRPAP
jgi:GTP-binding protein Era